VKRADTARGFARYDFADSNGEPCSLQKSSVATDDLVWLGRDGERTRMHLTRAQVAELLPLLQAFVDTGEIG
jgi:hypothetical protein